MDDPTLVWVEVAYATPERQVIIPLQVAPGTTVGQAIVASGIVAIFPEIDPQKNPVGIFSLLVSLDTLVQARDRVEIYRPLQADPKESRRRRAEKKRRLKPQKRRFKPLRNRGVKR
ncbi:MAG: RnfH family protein [Gammaproteobacteria bacterium]|nr:RnfH family protein [Gammaproteobacteria bacterium]